MRPTSLTTLCLVLTIAGAAQASAIKVTSPAIGADGRIPPAFSAYGANRSPPLAWTAVPGASAYAVVLDDPDAADPRPFVHWLIWNIPGSVTALPEGVPGTGLLGEPAGAAQGVNDHDRIGYWGPHPPSGVHHYHIRVFALDAPLALAPGSDRQALLAAMSRHVLGAGELVATYAAPAGR